MNTMWKGWGVAVLVGAANVAIADPIGAVPTIVAPATMPNTALSTESVGTSAWSLSVVDGLGLTRLIEVNDLSAWVIGAYVNYQSHDTRDGGRPNGALVRNSSRDAQAELSAGFRRYAPAPHYRFFTEVSAALKYGQTKNKYSTEITNSTQTAGDYTERRKGVGLSVMLGAEYFFAKSFSIEARVGPSITYYDITGTVNDAAFTNGSAPRTGNQVDVTLANAGASLNFYW